jgi:fatty acid desaturase
MVQTRTLFRYSRYDALPALGAVANLLFLLWTLVAFRSLSWAGTLFCFVVVSGLYCWNLQCVSHNFIHNPFFRSRWLNRLFSVLESVAIGMPHILYHHYHLNHHAGDNDAKGPNGTTRDWTSIYRYSKDDGPEPLWRYCLLSFFRIEVGAAMRVCIRHGRAHVWQAIAESIVLGLFWGILLVVDWRYFLAFYVPSYFLGWVLGFAQGYLEHYGARPGNPFANSVSSYNRLYNLLTFNNGYHQEHHWDPKMHWTRMAELHSRIRPHLRINRTRILRGPHLTALIEDFLERRQAKREERSRSAAA